MLSAEALKKIDREIAKYPPDQKRSAVMAALAIAQDEQGWLSTETMDFVAGYLDMPPIAVYEVATFYEMYNTEPIGSEPRDGCRQSGCCALANPLDCLQLSRPPTMSLTRTHEALRVTGSLWAATKEAQAGWSRPARGPLVGSPSDPFRAANLPLRRSYAVSR